MRSMSSNRVLISFALLASGACGAEGPENLAFPDGFLWGTAIAGFQADMGCPTLPREECEDENSDWYQFVTSPVFLTDEDVKLSGHPPSAGPGHFELYEADFDLAAHELANNAFRMSIEWSRIFPTATDGVDGHDELRAIADAGAVAHYHAVFAAMKERGIRPLVTLNHYSLPLWIHDAAACHVDLAGCQPRGWLAKDRTVREIAKFARFAAQEYGAEVDYWATINEPLQNSVFGYLLPVEFRTHPPAVTLEFEATKTASLALIEAHARMYDAVKAADTADADGDSVASMVGVVFPLTPGLPLDPENPDDVSAAKNFDYLWNRVYLNAVAKGELDADLDGVAEYREDLANRMDYIGVNYYFRFDIQGIGDDPVWPELSPLFTFNPATLTTTYDYPRGLYEMVMRVHEEYGLPVIVTENGAVDGDDTGYAPNYLVQHLRWLARAIRDGADVRGYFYWTFMDNYEWNHGMNVRMGLFAVDKDDPAKARVPRKTVAVYRQIAENGEVPPSLQEQYPEK